MSTQAFEIAQAVLLSIGGGSIIVFALSTFLGKIWAQRILQNEKLEHDREVALFKSQIESLADQKSLNYKQKLELYKVVSSPLVELVALIDKDHGLSEEYTHEFNRQRLHITAQLALFAPSNVFDAFNDMIDYIYNSLENKNYLFRDFRIKALNLLSQMRKDIGIYEDEVVYKGNR